MANTKSDFFDQENWWQPVALRLEAALPGSVKVMRKVGFRLTKKGVAIETVTITGWKVNVKYLRKRVRGWREWSPMRRQGNKLLCLLYCLYHEKRTVEAQEIERRGAPTTTRIATWLAST